MEQVPVALIDIAVDSWTIHDVEKWLALQNFSPDLRELLKSHEIDGYSLLRITEHDLRTAPLSLTKLGVIKRLAGAIAALKSTTIAKVDITKPGLPVKEENSNGNGNQTGRGVCHVFSSDGGDGASSSSSDTEEHRRLPPLKPEIGRAVIALGYFLVATVWTAFVMVIVHDRVPDMEKYPPLPDFVLDNVPLIPWAFDLCEVAGFILALTWVTVLLFHKYRFILIRRYFVLMGSIFILRSICMLITSMSVPGRHLKCAGKNFGDSGLRLRQALVIARGFGMSIQGVRTCGDYMFSGHTVVITVLNHFITEYTPKRYRMVHIASWVLNLFGMFFILAAHEHYSIDVFIAFYISSRLFLYYHTLANTDILRRFPRRANLYFPLYSFFEADVYRVVPNEYQSFFSTKWPFPYVNGISFEAVLNRTESIWNCFQIDASWLNLTGGDDVHIGLEASTLKTHGNLTWNYGDHRDGVSA
ncbi:Sphingomyelin synthase-related protein 1 [Hypsibius exemplaris]|uniref:Sphingomyelin synthase-related protein 1 n=1 Tax=Hypsibius exemplaris TaxID=2072580 RepID=A0A9X6NK88_HYPEX|nr:Sphingomyelin synthase-related protein 1 [Hypsibius exemplaris]